MPNKVGLSQSGIYLITICIAYLTVNSFFIKEGQNRFYSKSFVYYFFTPYETKIDNSVNVCIDNYREGLAVYLHNNIKYKIVDDLLVMI